MEVTLYVFVSWESQKRLKWERFESVGIQMEQRAFSRTAGIDTHAASAHNPHEHSRSRRSKICVNLCMGDSLSPPAFNSVCLWIFDALWASVCVCIYREEYKDWTTEKERKRTWQQRAKVLITYWSNLVDDSLKRWRAAQCTVQKKREETIYCSKVPQTLIFASLNVYHQFLAFEPCLTALQPLYHFAVLFYFHSTLLAFISSFASRLCHLASHFFSPLDILCSLQFLIVSASVTLSLFHMLWHLCLNDITPSSKFLGYQTVRIPFLCSSPSVYVLLSLCYLHKSVNSRKHI